MLAYTSSMLAYMSLCGKLHVQMLAYIFLHVGLHVHYVSLHGPLWYATCTLCSLLVLYVSQHVHYVSLHVLFCQPTYPPCWPTCALSWPICSSMVGYIPPYVSLHVLLSKPTCPFILGYMSSVFASMSPYVRQYSSTCTSI